MGRSRSALTLSIVSAVVWVTPGPPGRALDAVDEVLVLVRGRDRPRAASNDVEVDVGEKALTTTGQRRRPLDERLRAGEALLLARERDEEHGMAQFGPARGARPPGPRCPAPGRGGVGWRRG